MMEILKQDQYQPMPVEEQVAVLYAGTKGLMDSIPVDDIKRFESEYLEFLRASKSDLLSSIKEKKALDDDLENTLQAAVDEFKKSFQA
jgi:F-type H+-transporting ATPase subunit alpha